MAENIAIRDRKWALVLYPEDETHVAAVAFIKANYSYVLIFHDQDVWTEDDEKSNPEHKAGEKKKPHWHIILKFPEARYQNAIAKELGIASNYLQKISIFKSACLYLVHHGWSDKFQYSPELLEGPLRDAVLKFLANEDENQRVIQLVDLIDSMDYIDFSQLVKLACKQGLYAELRRMGYLASRIIDVHNANFTSDIEMREVWLKRLQVVEAREKRIADFEEFQRFTSGKTGDILPLEP